MNLISYRDKWATKMGLPLSARYKHDSKRVLEVAREILLQHKHVWDECVGRAEARLDGIEHQRASAKSFIITRKHNYRRWVEIVIVYLLIFLCLFLALHKAHAQNVTVRGVAKGTTVANTATVTANDANHNGMDVNVLNAGSGGTASSFGAAFPATGTAAGFSDGVNMLPATLDASGFLKINCAAGCVAGGSFADAAAFTFGTTTVSNTSFVVDDVATNTVAENSAGAARMNTNRILYMDISKTAANTIAIKVDGSAVTQPVSGTVAVTQSTSPWVISFTAPQHVIVDSGTTIVTQATGTNLHAVIDTGSTTAVTQATGTNLHMVCDSGCGGAATFADSSAFTFASTPVNNISAVVDDVATNTVAENSAGAVRMNTNRILYVDLSKTAANTNKILVTPDSVALPANQSVNMAQVAGTTTDTNSGVKSAGTLRVVLATDQPALTNKLLVTPDSVALPANQSVNVSQINGVTPLMGNGVTGTGSPRVTLASDGTAISTAGYMSVKIDQTTPGTTNLVAAAGTLADNGAAAATNRVGTLPSVTQTSYENGTASTQGRNAALNTGTDGLLWTANLPAIRPASYTASAAIAASSTTDNCRMPGNASNTVLVTMVKVSGTQTTAGSVTVTVNKRSTAGSGGTAANITVVPDDSNYAAGVSVPQSYTGTGPTVGTLVGAIDNMKVGFLATTTASPQDIYILNLRQKPIVLRGTAENLTVNLGGAVTGGNMTCTFNWIETATITP